MNAVTMALVLVAIPGLVLGQDVFWVATGAPDRHVKGFHMTGVGDVNLDGFEDLLTIVDPDCVGLPQGRLWLLSGSDGTLLREVSNSQSIARFETIAEAGDMNGDGVPDYCACEADNVNAWTDVRSGLNDAILWSVPGACSRLLSNLDVDGDGLRDLVVGHINSLTQGNVWVYSHGGTLLYTLVGGVPGPTHPALVIGLSLAKIGDVDDDGRDDFVMGCGEPTGRGAAVVVSGATGAYLRLCYGELVGDGLGEKVTECGDIDGDGYADFALGNGGNIFAWRGVVRFFSSRTGQVLHQLVSQPFSLEFGRSLASRGVDLDGDGKADVVVGQAGTGPVGPLYGSVHTFSGRDGSRLHSVASQPPQAGSGGQIGYFATTLRPRAGEHIGYFSVPNPTTLFGAGSTCGHHYGAIVTYKGLPRTAVTLGPSCRGNLTAPPNIGMSSLGTPGVRIHLSNAPAGSLAVLLLGLSTTNHHGVPLPASLDHLGLPGCSLRTSIELMCTAITGAAASATGHASIDLPFPVPSVGLGTWSLSAQWLVLGDATTFPGGMSQAIRWRR